MSVPMSSRKREREYEVDDLQPHDDRRLFADIAD